MAANKAFQAICKRFPDLGAYHASKSDTSASGYKADHLPAIEAMAVALNANPAVKLSDASLSDYATQRILFSQVKKAMGLATATASMGDGQRSTKKRRHAQAIELLEKAHKDQGKDDFDSFEVLKQCWEVLRLDRPVPKTLASMTIGELEALIAKKRAMEA